MSSRIRCGYCGPKSRVPPGYDFKDSPYRCLTKGISVGLHQERRKWQRDTGTRVERAYVSPCPHPIGSRRGRGSAKKKSKSKSKKSKRKKSKGRKSQRMKRRTKK